MNVVPTVITMISDAMAHAGSLHPAVAVVELCPRKSMREGQVGNPPLPSAHAHHRRMTRDRTDDHLNTERSASLPRLRTFRSLPAPLLSITSARLGENFEKPLRMPV